MDPYYLLNTRAFNKERIHHSTIQQFGIDDVYNNEPLVEFFKKDSQLLDNYTKYDLKTEKLVKQKGRAYNRTFDSFISIKDSSFYYHDIDRVTYLHCSKDEFQIFYKGFQKDNYFVFDKIDVDFEYIIYNQKSMGIEGVWLGKFDDANINALFLLGSNVDGVCQESCRINFSKKL